MQDTTIRLCGTINPILATLYKAKRDGDAFEVARCKAEIDNIWFDENQRAAIDAKLEA
jgi:hypothetical protein